MGSKILKVQKKIGSTKIVAPKRFWVRKNFSLKKIESENILGQKSFRVKKEFGTEKEKKLSEKKCLVPKRKLGPK